MRKYLILAHSEVTADALNSYLEIMGEASLPTDALRRIVWEGNDSGADAAISAYEWLVRRIEQGLNAEGGAVPRNEAMALVDIVRPGKLSAVHEVCNWEHLIALLVLSFPEIHWTFGALEGSEGFRPGHALEDLHIKCQRDPLLDPTGLRTWVRAQTNNELRLIGDDLRLPERKELAAAIDEEGHYAYLNAYTAYRFGCRADVVTTWTQMEEHFGSDGPSPHEYWLLLEDMSLNFADKPSHVHLLSLNKYTDEETGQPQGRSKWCPKLDSSKDVENSAYRILVTTGQARDDSTLKDNLKYLNEKKKGKGSWVSKPSRGIFGLWRDAELLIKPSMFGKLRNVVNFGWPPDEPPTLFPSRKFLIWPRPRSGHRGHGSPGKLMLVVNTLIRRSRAVLSKIDSVEAAVQGAVLATDALELTGGRTPTSAVDALALKHYFEVLAECQFAGVAYHIDTEGRWEDIDAETENISWWFHQKEIGMAKLNARMHVLNRVIGVLREHNKFDEEQQCMIKARSTHNTLWLKKRPWRLLFTPFLRYFELLMRSVLWFVVCLSVWILMFTWLFKWSASYSTYWYGFFDAVTSIFSISSPSNHYFTPEKLHVPSFYAALICGAMIIGVAHLGVFVSHLYTIASRK